MVINMNELIEILDNLIHDRTQSDVDYALACERNGVYIEDDLKGAYNVSDRNRVGNAVNFIVDCLAHVGMYEARLNVIRDDWHEYDIARPADNGKVLSALANLKLLLPYSQTAAVPSSLDGLTHQKANAVERVIYDVYGVFVRLWQSWLFCGDGFASDFDAPDTQIFDDNWIFDQTLC